ncbi:AI-2E family transporter [candidate division KSB1 bacterium]|nr:AI-2E family transporter [candidate division KSB1 bacterium]
MKPKSLKNNFFYLLLFVSTALVLWLLNDFLMPVFWAATFGILFYPIFKLIRRWLKNKSSLSSLVTILLIILIVILPSFFIGLAVSKQVTTLYNQYLADGVSLQKTYTYIESNLPGVISFLEKYGIDIDNVKKSLSSAILSSTRYLASKAFGLGGNVASFFLQLSVMIYLLFFFLRDGDKILSIIIQALPLGDKREKLLFSKFAEVTRATMKGTFVVGIIQGSLGGLAFWILGVEAAVLWGVIMIILSILPVVGSGLIWFPAAVILIISGSWIKGAILLIIGLFVIGLVDNFLRPTLVGRDTKMPDYLILLSTLGGLTLFGISGFIIGPVITALCLTVWQIFMKDYAAKDKL